jgi:2-amino-4-hydroxy-6-hydroxymethyldihydropteridine diphosphokinase
MATVYLALGTNLGERAANLRAALAALAPRVQVTTESHIYETAAWGVADQPAFLNMCIRAETDFAPLDLLAFIKELESALGRVPTIRYGPRRIDLDILFYEALVLDSPPLVIPHPRLHERAFVLVPLADIAPHFVHPVLGLTVFDLLIDCDLAGVQRFEPR